MSDTIVAGNGSKTVPEERLAWRRWMIFLLCAASWCGMGWAIINELGHGWLQSVIVALVLLGLPWTLLNFWNAVIGFAILRSVGDPAAFTNPVLACMPTAAPITTRTAICLAIRHEAVPPVFARLARLIEDLRASGEDAAFSIHVLSDSADAATVRAEEAAFLELRRRFAEEDRLHYRRRPSNAGFKAGNLRDFALRDGGAHDFMLVLDADSVMSAAAILRLVRMMQANPRLGILQTLAVGRPSANAFTRVFQFGMRNGMHTHATGLAWWQGPSGPYWGHNALIRIAPFVAHCALLAIPGNGPFAGPILSHDQVEAVLMRHAGYEVRLLPDEFGSWEENPPDLPSFIKRDLRWCQGNLQYLRLFGRLPLMPMGVFQLTNAVMMYLGAVFWILLLLLGLATAMTDTPVWPRASFTVYLIMLGLGFVPRLLGVIDVMLDAGRRRLQGGVVRLLLSTLMDVVFCILLGTSMAISQTIFIGGLLFGRRLTWESQQREGRGVRFAEAARHLWPQTLFGILMAYALMRCAPGALPSAAPTLASCLLAIPFAMVTASAGCGRFMRRAGLCAAPEEAAAAPVPATEHGRATDSPALVSR